MRRVVKHLLPPLLLRRGRRRRRDDLPRRIRGLRERDDVGQRDGVVSASHRGLPGALLERLVDGAADVRAVRQHHRVGVEPCGVKRQYGVRLRGGLLGESRNGVRRLRRQRREPGKLDRHCGVRVCPGLLG